MGGNEVLDGVWGEWNASFPEPRGVFSSYPERQGARRRRSPGVRDGRNGSERMSLDGMDAKHVEGRLRTPSSVAYNDDYDGEQGE